MLIPFNSEEEVTMLATEMPLGLSSESSIWYANTIQFGVRSN
jgi:hypothetical protein